MSDMREGEARQGEEIFSFCASDLDLRCVQEAIARRCLTRIISAEHVELSELRSRPVRWYRYNCDRLFMRVKNQETHAAQTGSAYNIHRVSDEKQRLIFNIRKDYDVRYLSGEALRVIFPETLTVLLIYAYI